jgi:flagellar motor switch/type III secretory pathway protein FliN
MSSSQSSSSSSSPTPALAQLPAGPDLAGLLDVDCPVEIVLGTGRISVRECLALTPTTIVRLVEAAGEDVQLMVGSVPVARGEVVVDDERAVVRVTEVLPGRTVEATE